MGLVPVFGGIKGHQKQNVGVLPAKASFLRVIYGETGSRSGFLADSFLFLLKPTNRRVPSKTRHSHITGDLDGSGFGFEALVLTGKWGSSSGSTARVAFYASGKPPLRAGIPRIPSREVYPLYPSRVWATVCLVGATFYSVVRGH